MSLSDKIYYPMGDEGGELRVIWVKQALKELQESIRLREKSFGWLGKCIDSRDLINVIERIFGEELLEEKE